MLDSTITDYSLQISVTEERRTIILDGFSDLANKLVAGEGQVITWSTDNNNLKIHYLVKSDHLKNFPASLISDLRKGKASLEIKIANGKPNYVVKRR